MLIRCFNLCNSCGRNAGQTIDPNYEADLIAHVPATFRQFVDIITLHLPSSLSDFICSHKVDGIFLFLLRLNDSLIILLASITSLAFVFILSTTLARVVLFGIF